MSLSLKNITILGGSGAVGKGVINALITIPNSFNITITSRHGTPRPASIPSHFNWLPLDYEDANAISAALKGQDAVLLLFNFGGLHLQKVVLDAAIDQRVKFFIPSFYGLDSSPFNPSKEDVKALGLLGDKIDFEIYLRDRADKGEINFTAIYNSLYLDYGLDHGTWFGFDIKNHTAKIVDDGLAPVHTSSIPQIGEVTVKVLLNPDAYKNKSVKISTFTVTQQSVLAELEKQTGKTWKKEYITSEDVFKQGLDAFHAGNLSTAGVTLILAAITEPNDKYHVRFSQEEAKEFDLTPTTTEEVIKKVLAELA